MLTCDKIHSCLWNGYKLAAAVAATAANETIEPTATATASSMQCGHFLLGFSARVRHAAARVPRRIVSFGGKLPAGERRSAVHAQARARAGNNGRTRNLCTDTRFQNP